MNTTPENLRLTTGRLYWQPTGENGYIDFGNCTSHKMMPEVQRADHYRFANGKKVCDMSLVTSLKPKRVFTFDEHFGERLRVMNFAGAATEVVQAASVGLDPAVTFSTYRPGDVYLLSKLNVTNLIVTDATSLAILEEDVHYKVDRGSGLITVLATEGTPEAGRDWEIEVEYGAATRLNFAMFSRLLEQGTFQFVESDQYDAVPAGRETITGTVYVTGWGDGASDKFQEYTVEVLSIE